MATPENALADLRINDLLVWLAVKRRSSVHAAARELRVATSQVSKSVARLEAFFGTRLLVRGARGVTLTETGERLLPHVEELVARLRFLQRNERLPVADEITIAAPSYLCALFVPPIARSATGLRVRALELPPTDIRALSTENWYDAAILIDDNRFGAPWVGDQIGVLRKGLFAAPRVVASLGPQPVAVERVRELPFVTPVSTVNGRLVQGDDDCPLGRFERKVGHEVQTIGLAFEVAATTDNVAFGPAAAARRLVERRALEEIRVAGWNERSPLFLVCNADRVRARLRSTFVAAMRKELDAVS